jgi:hypothetical protein
MSIFGRAVNGFKGLSRGQQFAVTQGAGLGIGLGAGYLSAPQGHKKWGLIGGVPGGLVARGLYGKSSAKLRSQAQQASY